MPLIVITGAGSGIGRDTARLFLANGWHVAALGRREAALRETLEGHPHGLAVPCDVTSEAEVDAAFAAATAHGEGRIDALFNNAGVSSAPAPIDETPVAQWRQVIDANLTGSFLCARAAFRQMRAQDPQGGRIINNGSISAHVPRPGMAAYTASKHAITGLTRTLSLDGRRFGIACGQVDIGNAATAMAATQAAGVMQADGTVRAEAVMPTTEVARAVWQMATLPEGTNVQFMTIMATTMPYIGRG